MTLRRALLLMKEAMPDSEQFNIQMITTTSNLTNGQQLRDLITQYIPDFVALIGIADIDYDNRANLPNFTLTIFNCLENSTGGFYRINNGVIDVNGKPMNATYSLQCPAGTTLGIIYV